MAARKGTTGKGKKEKVSKAPKQKKPKKSKKTNDMPDPSLPLDGGFASNPIAKKTKFKAPRVAAGKDVYTLVLLLSFIFFIAAVVFLYLDMASYK